MARLISFGHEFCCLTSVLGRLTCGHKLVLLLCAMCSPASALASISGGEADSSSLRALIQAREMYALVRHPDPRLPELQLSRRRTELIDHLKRLADSRPNPSAIRRLSLIQFALGDERWRMSIARLSNSGSKASPFEAERELSMWRAALNGDRISPARALALRKQIGRLHLGWYEHLALEAVYSHAGMEEEALSESHAALRSSSSVLRFLQFQETLGRLGMVIGSGMGVFLFWRRRHPLSSVPSILKFSHAQDLTAPQSQGLYVTFLLYLASYAAIQYVAGRILNSNSVLSDESMDIGRALWSMAVIALWIAAPYLYLRKMSKRTDLTKDRVGFRTSSVFGDILWGLGGYMVAIPLVWFANSLSERLFISADTPLAPVLSSFAGSRDQFVQILLLSQAVLIAPIIEETLFRGVLYRSLQFRMSWMWAMLVTAAIFSLLHPQMPVGFLGLFVLGLVLNGLYVLRGSLLPCIVAHSLNNAMIFASLTLLLSS